MRKPDRIVTEILMKHLSHGYALGVAEGVLFQALERCQTIQTIHICGFL